MSATACSPVRRTRSSAGPQPTLTLQTQTQYTLLLLFTASEKNCYLQQVRQNAILHQLFDDQDVGNSIVADCL